MKISLKIHTTRKYLMCIADKKSKSAHGQPLDHAHFPSVLNMQFGNIAKTTSFQK